MHSHLGAVIIMVILLLTIDHWTFDVAAFPLFIACMASVEVFLVGVEPGPRLRRSRRQEAAELPEHSRAAGGESW